MGAGVGGVSGISSFKKEVALVIAFAAFCFCSETLNHLPILLVTEGFTVSVIAMISEVLGIRFLAIGGVSVNASARSFGFNNGKSLTSAALSVVALVVGFMGVGSVVAGGGRMPSVWLRSIGTGVAFCESVGANHQVFRLFFKEAGGETLPVRPTSVIVVDFAGVGSG